MPKKKGAIEIGPQYLEKHLLNTPSIAIEQARRETARMLGVASEAVSNAVKGFFEGNMSVLKQTHEMEQAVDNLQSEITQYLVEISQKDLAQDESRELPVLIHSVNDAERIGDHSENIAELAERKIEKKLPFTNDAIKELRLMWNELHSMMVEASIALEKNDSTVAKGIILREERINKFQIKLRTSHVNRLNEGKCNIISGIAFIDVVDNLEKIGDHLTNIAQGILEGMRWREYVESKKEKITPSAV